MAAYIKSCLQMLCKFNNKSQLRGTVLSRCFCLDLCKQCSAFRYTDSLNEMQEVPVVKAYNLSQSSNGKKRNKYTCPEGNVHLSYLFVPLVVKKFFGMDDNEETPEQKLIKHIKNGILLIQNGELQKAERLLHVALKMAQDQRNEDGITYIYDVLANLAFDKEEYMKAEKLFISVLQRSISNGLPQDDIKVVHISLKLAKVYEALNDFPKCEQGFRFCIDTLKKRISEGASDEDTLLLWAMTLDWFARFLLLSNKTSEALEHLKVAYNTVVEVSGINHDQTVVILNDLGTVSSISGDQEAAAGYFQQAISIAKSLKEVPEIASIMVNLGVVQMKRGDYEQAKHWCESAQEQASQEKNRESYTEAGECLNELKQAMSNTSKVLS